MSCSAKPSRSAKTLYLAFALNVRDSAGIDDTTDALQLGEESPELAYVGDIDGEVYRQRIVALLIEEAEVMLSFSSETSEVTSRRSPTLSQASTRIVTGKDTLDLPHDTLTSLSFSSSFSTFEQSLR